MTIGLLRTHLHRSALLLACGAAACGQGATLQSALTPDVLLERAHQQFRNGKFRSAKENFERVAYEYPPGHPNLAEARYYLAESLFQSGNYIEAATQHRRVAEDHPTSPYAPLGLLRGGDAHLKQWRHPELDPTEGQTAMAMYQELAGRYPGTDAAARAQIRVLGLREWFAEKTYRNGMFYVRRKAYDSAIMYFKEIVANYAELDRAPDALLQLVEIYRIIEYREERRETCEHLRRYYAQAKGLNETCPAAPAGP